MSRGGPGRARGILGVSGGLPGGSRGALSTPQHPPWEPSGLHFGCLFGYFCPLNFQLFFFYNFGRHSGSIFAPFWLTKSASEPPGCKKVDMRKPLFYLSKTILFELGGSPGLPISLPEATSEFKTFFYIFVRPKSPENSSRMSPK